MIKTYSCSYFKQWSYFKDKFFTHPGEVSRLGNIQNKLYDWKITQTGVEHWEIQNALELDRSFEKGINF